MNAIFRMIILAMENALIQRETINVLVQKGKLEMPKLQIAQSMRIFRILLEWPFVSILFGFEENRVLN